MQIGMIGLGKMGNFMAQRLMKAGHDVIGFDPNGDARKALGEAGGRFNYPAPFFHYAGTGVASNCPRHLILASSR